MNLKSQSINLARFSTSDHEVVSIDMKRTSHIQLTLHGCMVAWGIMFKTCYVQSLRKELAYIR